jgi:hypothetical protein
MPLTAISGKSRLWVLEPVTSVELPKKVFTSTVRLILSWRRVICFRLNITLSQMFYLLKHLLFLYLVFSKQRSNNLINTLITSLYVAYVCLCILASSGIPQSILRWWTPLFKGVLSQSSWWISRLRKWTALRDFSWWMVAWGQGLLGEALWRMRGCPGGLRQGFWFWDIVQFLKRILFGSRSPPPPPVDPLSFNWYQSQLGH